MVYFLLSLAVFLVWAIGHVESRMGWHDDEVAAERWSAALREDRS